MCSKFSVLKSCQERGGNLSISVKKKQKQHFYTSCVKIRQGRSKQENGYKALINRSARHLYRVIKSTQCSSFPTIFHSAAAQQCSSPAGTLPINTTSNC